MNSTAIDAHEASNLWQPSTTTALQLHQNKINLDCINQLLCASESIHIENYFGENVERHTHTHTHTDALSKSDAAARHAVSHSRSNDLHRANGSECRSAKRKNDTKLPGWHGHHKRRDSAKYTASQWNYSIRWQFYRQHTHLADGWEKTMSNKLDP